MSTEDICLSPPWTEEEENMKIQQQRQQHLFKMSHQSYQHTQQEQNQQKQLLQQRQDHQQHNEKFKVCDSTETMFSKFLI